MPKGRMILQGWTGTWGTMTAAQAGMTSDQLCKPVNMTRYNNGLIGPLPQPQSVTTDNPVAVTADSMETYCFPTADGNAGFISYQAGQNVYGWTMSFGTSSFTDQETIVASGSRSGYVYAPGQPTHQQITSRGAVLTYGESAILYDPDEATAYDNIGSNIGECTAVAFHDGRMYVGRRETLYYGNLGITKATMSALQFVDISATDMIADRGITSLVSMPWGLVIGRFDGIWLLNGTPEVGNIRRISRVGVWPGMCAMGDFAVGATIAGADPLFVRGTAVERPLLERYRKDPTTSGYLASVAPRIGATEGILLYEQLLYVNGFWGEHTDLYWQSVGQTGELYGSRAINTGDDITAFRMPVLLDECPTSANARTASSVRFELPQFNPEGDAKVKIKKVVAIGRTYNGGGSGQLDCEVYAISTEDGTVTSDTALTATWSDPASDTTRVVVFNPVVDNLIMATDFQIIFDAVKNFAFERVIVWYDVQEQESPSR